MDQSGGGGLRVPTSPLDPALRASFTPPTGNNVDVQIQDVNPKASICPPDRGSLSPGWERPAGGSRVRGEFSSSVSIPATA